MGRFVLGLILVLVISAMAGEVLANQGMKWMNPSRKSCFIVIEVFGASAFGVIYLGEPLSPCLLIGSIVIFVYGATLMFPPLRPKPMESAKEGV
jgi:drug/metabolite transporter (DMT)-like permease